MAGQQAVLRRRPHLVAAVAVVASLVMVSGLFVQRARADQRPIEPGDTAALVVGAADPCAGEHWVGAWRAAPQASSIGRPDEADGPARTFVDQTLRMIVSPRATGSALRVLLGNRHGPAPVTVDAVTIARHDVGAAVQPGTVQALTFGGSPSVVIAPGEQVVSDPLAAAVAPFHDLAISLHVAGTAVLDHHQWASSTQYAAPPQSGDHTLDVDAAAFTEELTGWFGVAGLDVLAPRAHAAVVTMGDSITDGVGSTPNANRRWPDALARRLIDGGVPLSVVNAGIGGNHVVTSAVDSDRAIGPSVRARLDDDALGVAGVTDLFLFAGINDIYNADPSVDIAAALIDGYRAIIDQAHAAGLRVIGATVTPANLSGGQEAARTAVNEWIRTSGAYDAVVDFDAVARDPGTPARVRPAWDAAFAHLNDAGYEALAAAVPLDAFRGSDCAATGAA